MQEKHVTGVKIKQKDFKIYSKREKKSNEKKTEKKAVKFEDKIRQKNNVQYCKRAKKQ